MFDNEKGLTTIEEVRKTIEAEYSRGHILSKIMFKAWLYHSESRNKNGNKPFTFDNYTRHMSEFNYLEQVKLNMLNCDDIGGKEEVEKFLVNRICS